MNCDGIARWYRALEHVVFGRALERRRFEYLNEVADARHVLILGDGDGRFTAEFVRRNSGATVESVDLSARMIAMASRGVGGYSTNVRFRVGDARSIAFEGTYDLVVTHFFLDCFENDELNGLVERVAERCEVGARWVISEFGLPESGLERIAAWVLVRFMYFCFWFTTGLKVNRLPDYASALERQGFQVLRRSAVLGGLLVSEIRGRRDESRRGRQECLRHSETCAGWENVETPAGD
jgi:SAM-dependent methyltransferase